MNGRDNMVISADGHIDLPLLPHDLFDRFAPPSLRPRMPRVIERDGGQYWVDENGGQLAFVGGSGNSGQAYVRGKSTALRSHERERLLGRLREGRVPPHRSGVAGRGARS